MARKTTSNGALPPSVEDQIVVALEQTVYDPMAFVNFAFPWGEPGDLADATGPDVWQARLGNELGKQLRAGDGAVRMACSSGHGIGKVQCNQLLIPTPDGERRWGDIQVGDYLFDRDGNPTRVVQKFPHTDWPFYRVEFDDGSFTYAGPEHLWSVRGRQERRKGRPDVWRTMSTQEIIDAGVLRDNGVAQARQWEIPTQGSARFTPREVPVHPYVLGVWIGDGSVGRAGYTKPFEEIADRIRTFGVAVSTGEGHDRHGLLGQGSGLKEAGVLGLRSYERYIPDDYKFNTPDVRRLVLEGLLDTDGECDDRASVGYATTSRRLADDVIWLARSLGGKASMQPTPKQGWYPDENGMRKVCRICYRVTLNLPWNPFSVEHRKTRYKPSQERYTKRWIARIEFDHFGDGHCVVVDNGYHLYQTNDFIVTHNSALVSWLILWFMSTRPHPQIIVMANTREQLLKKTFRELSVWHKRLINKHWFEWTATKFYHKQHPETWFCNAASWSKDHTEAAAGTHAKHVMVLFDESAGIYDGVWETLEGAQTTDSTIWLAFGNPTRNTGRFRECFGRYKHRWTTYKVDSREAKMTNKTQLQEWVDDYGEDSDFVRVRVRGEFPRAGTTQFIDLESVEKAMARAVADQPSAPRILSVDVARFGDDQTVICHRLGRKVLPLTKYRGLDTMQVAAMVAERIDAWHPDATFIDGAGLGAGVVDRLRSLGYSVFDVLGNTKPDDPQKYANKRAECWGKMRDWLVGECELPRDDGLRDALIGVEYGYNAGMAIQLEKKSDMKARGLASPDEADALSLGFAEPVRYDRVVELPAGLVLPPMHYKRIRRREDLNWRVV